MIVRSAPLCVALLVAIAAPSAAKDLRRVGVYNATGRDAAALVLTFSEQSGKVVIAGAPTVFPDRGSCGAPRVDITRSRTVHVSWGATCVQPGASVWCMVVSSARPLAFTNGAWIGATGDTLGPVTPDDVQASDVERTTVVSRPVLLALLVSLLLNAALIWWTGRRRTRPRAV